MKHAGHTSSALIAMVKPPTRCTVCDLPATPDTPAPKVSLGTSATDLLASTTTKPRIARRRRSSHDGAEASTSMLTLRIMRPDGVELTELKRAKSCYGGRRLGGAGAKPKNTFVSRNGLEKCKFQGESGEVLGHGDAVPQPRTQTVVDTAAGDGECGVRRQFHGVQSLTLLDNTLGAYAVHNLMFVRFS